MGCYCNRNAFFYRLACPQASCSPFSCMFDIIDYVSTWMKISWRVWRLWLFSDCQKVLYSGLGKHNKTEEKLDKWLGKQSEGHPNNAETTQEDLLHLVFCRRRRRRARFEQTLSHLSVSVNETSFQLSSASAYLYTSVSWTAAQRWGKSNARKCTEK